MSAAAELLLVTSNLQKEEFDVDLSFAKQTQVINPLSSSASIAPVISNTSLSSNDHSAKTNCLSVIYIKTDSTFTAFPLQHHHPKTARCGLFVHCKCTHAQCFKKFALSHAGLQSAVRAGLFAKRFVLFEPIDRFLVERGVEHPAPIPKIFANGVILAAETIGAHLCVRVDERDNANPCWLLCERMYLDIWEGRSGMEPNWSALHWHHWKLMCMRVSTTTWLPCWRSFWSTRRRAMVCALTCLSKQWWRRFENSRKRAFDQFELEEHLHCLCKILCFRRWKRQGQALVGESGHCIAF